MGGRDQSERLGAINRNQGSQSAGARSLPTLGRAVPPSPGVVYRCGRATSFPVPHCSSTTATSPNVPAIHTLSPATESGPGLQLVVVPDHQRAAPHIDVLMRRTRTGCRTSGLRDVLMTHLPDSASAAGSGSVLIVSTRSLTASSVGNCGRRGLA